MQLLSDKQIVKKINEGDINSFNIFFSRYYSLLCGVAFLYLRDEENVKDLVQDFFSDFWVKKIYNSLDEDREIKAYLIRSIKNRAINKIKKLENENKNQKVYFSLSEYEPDIEVRSKIYCCLEQAVSALPLQRKEALNMVYYNKRSYQEAADEMGISINSLKTHLKIALKDLRYKLKNIPTFNLFIVFFISIL
ncbi:sigma-70 family RNA polymerase sigma factor [Pedobacter sp. ASV1-7]|uniref:RNA polymerase sigma factor n=1 Tax=Pedobacter sp. ASV1-7 TaxID=3145237 RepID=UPI0032E89A4A